MGNIFPHTIPTLCYGYCSLMVSQVCVGNTDLASCGFDILRVEVDRCANLPTKQTNNGNLLFANAVNAVIRLLLLFPRDLRIQQSMKLTVINNSCNYVLASPPAVSHCLRECSFHSIYTEWCIAGARSWHWLPVTGSSLMYRDSEPNKKWAAGYLIEISSSDGTLGAGNVSRWCVANNKSCNFEWRDSIVETRGYIFGC